MAAALPGRDSVALLAPYLTLCDLEPDGDPIATRYRGRESRTGAPRLLQWIVAWSGLSAAWFIGDGDSPEIDLTIAAFALAEIDR